MNKINKLKEDLKKGKRVSSKDIEEAYKKENNTADTFSE